MSESPERPEQSDQYEVYKEVWKITEWKDGAVYRTESVGSGWFLEAVVKANRPAVTNLIYSVPSLNDPTAPTLLIRKVR